MYAVGRRRLSRLGIWMAAVLACGPGAVLSQRAAAALFGMRRGCPARIDVAVARRLGRRPGVRAHRATLPADEVTAVEGIPVTTAARTLFDLAGVLDRPELERAIEQADALGLSDRTPLVALVERYRGRPGTAALRAILREERRAAGATRSELEDAFLAFLAERGLPAPRSISGYSWETTGSRPTARGRPSVWSPSSTAGPITAPARPSSATGGEIGA